MHNKSFRARETRSPSNPLAATRSTGKSCISGTAPQFSSYSKPVAPASECGTRLPAILMALVANQHGLANSAEGPVRPSGIGPD
jgi:hypothetical protein